MAGPSLLQRIIILATFFVCGAFSAVLGNVMYTTKAVGLHNRVIEFRKPWFQNWAMFVGMSVLIVNTPCVCTCKCPQYVVGGKVRGWGLVRLVSIPALCDLTASILQNIALLFLVPSVWQMLRGCILLFTALLAIFYRHQKLRQVDWLGVLTTLVGVTIVGVSALLRGDAGADSSIANAPKGMKILAMGLMVIGQALQAFQTVVEEELLHDIDATESEVVAFEGLWGLYFTTFLAMPLAGILPESWGIGIYENSIESFKMVAGSGKLIGLVIGFCVVICGLNIAGMMVTSFSSAIHRNIYEALRSIAVWALSVIIFYIWPDSGSGESVDKWSALQGAGFLVSILGSFLYNRVIKLPGFVYDEVPTVDLSQLETCDDKTYMSLVPG
jgi:drug/metabolite transporter (DMT)-like permease